jgi:hypothetical protein
MPIYRPNSPPLKHRVESEPTDEHSYIVVGMDYFFPGILRDGIEPHEAPVIAVASYPPFQVSFKSYLYLPSHPKHCLNRVSTSSAFQRMSINTLRRLSFSKTYSIRGAAEMEILRRERNKHQSNQ